MEKVLIEIEMENGDVMKGELYPEVAPITVENFLKLIDEDFFAGLIFHRVIPGFMIQGGGYTKDFKEKHCDSIKGEFKSNGVNNELKHTEGTSLHVLKIRAINLKSHLRYFKGFNNCYIWL